MVEKMLLWVVYTAFYWFAGFVAVLILDYGFGVINFETMTTAESIGFFVFWPFFLIKYLFIGLGAVVSSTYYLLIGA